MPIKIADQLPAKKRLAQEHIFTIDELRAQSQDIRPLQILILNLMPLKEETELHLLRQLGNSPLQIEIDFCHMKSHDGKNTAASHLSKFYMTFDEISQFRYDGMIVTGAPVEQLEFKDVDYWKELAEIFDWSKHAVYSTLHICWGAQAGLYHHYGVDKILLDSKLFGVYKEDVSPKPHELLRGFDDLYYIPQSRYTTVDDNQIREHKDLFIISSSKQIGPNIITNSTNRHVFVLGHFEYDRMTLAQEYFRDLGKGMDIALPENYFPDDNVNRRPINKWRAHSHLFYNNWLNMIYQGTPFNLGLLPVIP